MSNNRNNTAQSTTPATQSKPWTWWQTTIVIVAIFIGTAGCIRAMHKPQPIKEAVASLVKTIPFLAPLFAPFILDTVESPGPAMSSRECECPIEIKPDGSALTNIDGKSVPALNHEFGS